MAPHYDVDDDWSDSDEETGCDIETSVQLGVPDGPLDSAEDRLDAAVSRIGGHPAFLTSPEPPIESALCKNCSTSMELLVQVWCPMEESPCDRALYVWGCSRGVCQKLEGSVRAWRGLKFNEKYAAKLQNRKEKQRQKELARVKADEEEAKRKSSMKTNPFSMGATPSALNSFGLGTAIFGQCEPKELNEEIEGELDKIIGEGDDAAEDSESSEQDEAEDGLLVTAMAATTLESSPWASAPAYDVLYLSTIAEYLPPAPKPKLSISKEDEVNGDNMEGGSKVKDTTWGLEGYENSLDIDHAFERFSKRVGYEGEQCLRYELCGTPLPFGSDKVFDLLFPPPPKPNLPVTKPDSMVVPPVKRTYDPSSVPMCPHCQGKRVFECQLMPNLINVLKRVNESQGKEKTKQTDEERRKEVGKQLNSTADIDRVGMEWGTCFVFSCERDCCIEAGSDVKNCWREEVVFVQWDV